LANLFQHYKAEISSEVAPNLCTFKEGICEAKFRRFRVRQQYPYVKVQARWCDLYRAIDRDGNLVDVRLSSTRDLAAAETFFRSAWTVTGVTPDRMTTDDHDTYLRAIRHVFGHQVTHRTNRHLNNHLE
jgi:transposase-like protein